MAVAPTDGALIFTAVEEQLGLASSQAKHPRMPAIIERMDDRLPSSPTIRKFFFSHTRREERSASRRLWAGNHRSGSLCSIHDPVVATISLANSARPLPSWIPFPLRLGRAARENDNKPGL